jgi:hypothetical protein
MQNNSNKPGLAEILKSDDFNSPLRSLNGRTIVLADKYEVTMASHCQNITAPPSKKLKRKNFKRIYSWFRPALLLL